MIFQTFYLQGIRDLLRCLPLFQLAAGVHRNISLCNIPEMKSWSLEL